MLLIFLRLIIRKIKEHTLQHFPFYFNRLVTTRCISSFKGYWIYGQTAINYLKCNFTVSYIRTDNLMKLLWRTLFCLMHAYYTKDNSGKASSITSSERALYIQMSKLMLYLRIILLLF